MSRPLDKRSASLAVGLLAAVAACATTGAVANPAAPISTVAGNGSAGYLLDNVLATSTPLNAPGEVALAGDGSFLIADTENHRVRRVSPNGVITTVAGDGVAGYGGEMLPATLNSLHKPAGVAALANGGFLIADRDNHRIRRVTAQGAIATVAGDGTQGGGGDGGQATMASLDSPDDVSPTPDGGFLIADTGNDRIREVDPSGVIRTVAGGAGGDDVNVGDGGPATSAHLDEPRGVAALSDGSYLIADTKNHRIRVVDPTGRISTVAGKNSYGFSGDGVPATAAKLDEPSDVTAVPGGGFLIADRKNNRVRHVSPGGIIATLAGNGSAGYNGDGIPATTAALNEPFGVALASDDLLYVADTFNHRIRRVPVNLSATGVQPAEAEPSDLAPPPPVAGKRVNLAPVRGRVRVKRPRDRGFRLLTEAEAVPVGSLVDTKAGAVRLTSAADLRGGQQQAVFYDGLFAVRQRRTRRPVTSLVLSGGDLGSCRRRRSARRSTLATASRRRARRGLWGRGKGRFRTRGRHGAATVRGTTWFTGDRCDGTVVRVRRGVVAVRDFRAKRRVLVRAGRSYLARARGSRDRRER